MTRGNSPPRGLPARAGLYAAACAAAAAALLSVKRSGHLGDILDWRTAGVLGGMLLLTTGMKESGGLRFLAERAARGIRGKRTLVLLLAAVSAVFAAVFTNDAALFVMVPLTLEMKKALGADTGKVVVFETLAVNAGSALTPIGNPQNIFLYHRWGIPFHQFITRMAPLTALLMAVLALGVFLVFPAEEIPYEPPDGKTRVDQRGIAVFGMLLAAFLAALELGVEEYLLPVMVLAVLVVRRRTFLEMDWGFLLLFVVVMVVSGALAHLGFVQRCLSSRLADRPLMTFWTATLLSQTISNVPSAVLLAGAGAPYEAIAYGVNVGGAGLPTGSFANIIALRLGKDVVDWRIFIRYSLPFYGITAVLAGFLTA